MSTTPPSSVVAEADPVLELTELLGALGRSVESVLVVRADADGAVTRTRVEFTSRRGGRTLALLDRYGDVADARGPDGPLLLAHRETEGRLRSLDTLGDLEDPVPNAGYTRLVAAVEATRARGLDPLSLLWPKSTSRAWRHLWGALRLVEVPAAGFERTLDTVESLASGAPPEWVLRRYGATP